MDDGITPQTTPGAMPMSTPTKNIIDWTLCAERTMADPAADAHTKNGAAFAWDKNMDELDRRAAAGDAEAREFLDALNDLCHAADADYLAPDTHPSLTLAARKMWC